MTPNTKADSEEAEEIIKEINDVIEPEEITVSEETGE